MLFSHTTVEYTYANTWSKYSCCKSKMFRVREDPRVPKMLAWLSYKAMFTPCTSPKFHGSWKNLFTRYHLNGWSLRYRTTNVYSQLR